MSPVTPHQNDMIKQVFATVYSRMRSMMVHAGLHENLNTGLWPKSTATVTKLENIMFNPYEEKYAYKKF